MGEIRVDASAAPHPDRIAPAFYRAMHRAFDDTVAQYRGRPDLVDALLSQAFDSFDGNVAIQSEGQPDLA